MPVKARLLADFSSGRELSSRSLLPSGPTVEAAPAPGLFFPGTVARPPSMGWEELECSRPLQSPGSFISVPLASCLGTLGWVRAAAEGRVRNLEGWLTRTLPARPCLPRLCLFPLARGLAFLLVGEGLSV